MEEITPQHGRVVRWRPFLLGVVFKQTGGQPLTPDTLVGRYALHDWHRLARLLQRPSRLPPELAVGPVAPSRAFYWLEAHAPERAVPFARAVFQRCFGEGRDITRPRSSLDLAAHLGADRQRPVKTRQPASVARLQLEAWRQFAIFYPSKSLQEKAAGMSARVSQTGLLECVDALYTAAGSGVSWDAAAERIRCFVGVDFVNLSHVNPERGIASSYPAGRDRRDVATYLRDWSHRDPLPVAQMGQRPGTLTRAEELLSWQGYRRLDVFEGFYEPVGMVYQAASHVPFGHGWFAMLGIANGWGSGPLSGPQLGRLGAVVPHMRKAMALANRLECLATRASAAEELLTRCRSAIVLCAACGRVTDLSPPAAALLKAFRAVLRIRGGWLEAVDAAPRRRLTALLADPGYCAGYAGPRLALKDPDTGDTLECTVLVLDADLAEQGTPLGEAERLVLLRHCGAPPEVDSYYLRHRFGLTPTEAAVLAALMEGHDLERIATDRGSTLQTVRTYVKSLRRKLDCRRQAEVVAKAWRAVLGMVPVEPSKLSP